MSARLLFKEQYARAIGEAQVQLSPKGKERANRLGTTGCANPFSPRHLSPGNSASLRAFRPCLCVRRRMKERRGRVRNDRERFNARTERTDATEMQRCNVREQTVSG